MPTYTSRNTSAVYSGEPYFRIVPGDNVTDQYIKDLPTGVTLTDHEPYVQPWELLATVSSYPSASINIASYDGLIINNETNGNIVVEANGDTSNALRLWLTLSPFLISETEKRAH